MKVVDRCKVRDGVHVGAFMNRLIEHLRRSSLSTGVGRTDGELLDSVLGRDDGAALEALIRRHGPMVWGVCRRFLRGHQDAEDAFQATFLVLVQKAATLPDRATVGNWLYGVARQTAVRMRAIAIQRAEREMQVVDIPEPTTADQYVWNDLKPVLDEELGRLPGKYRVLIVLCDLEGRTRKEVAGQLAIPEGTVASRLAAARAMLAKRLAGRGVVVSGVLLGTVLLAHASPAIVPAAVITNALKSAALVAAEHGAVGALSPTVATLITGVTRAMFVSKLKSVTAVVLIAGLALGGAGLGAGVFSGSDAMAQPNPKAAPVTTGAPVPEDRGEGRIILWRDGHPVAINPGTKATVALDDGFKAGRGGLRVGPDGQFLVYVSNRTLLRPVSPKQEDQVYIQKGKEVTKIETSCLLHAFWGADGLVYGYGFEPPKWGDPVPRPDLTKEFVNWSFDPRVEHPVHELIRTGTSKLLKMPGNVSVLDRTPDGKTFLVLFYEKPPKPVDPPPMRADPPRSEVYRLGLLPAEGGEFVPLTKTDEQTPGDFRLSPDGKFALGTMYRMNSEPPRELVVFDLQTKARSTVALPKDARVAASCWSPDGKQIAFVWESQAAFAERNKVLPGPVSPGNENKSKWIVTVAKPDGSDAKEVYTNADYLYGSIDWR